MDAEADYTLYTENIAGLDVSKIKFQLNLVGENCVLSAIGQRRVEVNFIKFTS